MTRHEAVTGRVGPAAGGEDGSPLNDRNQGTATRPRIALTCGDPAGIGPELIVKLLATTDAAEQAQITLLASRAQIRAAEAITGLTVPLADQPQPGRVVLDETDTADADRRDSVTDPTGARPLPAAITSPEVAQSADASSGHVPKNSSTSPQDLRPIPVGVSSPEAGAYALRQLDRALSLVSTGQADGIVFGPLNKASLHAAGMTEHDELRWFAKRLGHTGTTSEVNISPTLWTSRVTSHIPLKDVSAGITVDGVIAASQLLHDLLRRSGIASPRLAVCALNPHAGDNGNFGDEEITIIGPAVEQAAHSGLDIEGPFPCDTIFLAARRGDYDGIVTMYHDQGQIAMKLMGFDGGVTLEGGLPIPVATPAHGTAFDLVGRGVANLTSMANAFATVASLIRGGQTNE